MIRRRFSLKLVFLISIAFIIPVATSLITLKFSSDATIARFSVAEENGNGTQQKLLDEIFPKGRPDIEPAYAFEMLQKYEKRRTFGLFTSFLVISFVLAAIVLLLSIIILKRAMLTLRDLSQAAYQVGSGNLDVEIHPHSNDEFANLANTFTDMTKKLRDTTVSRDFYNRVLERMPVAVFTIDADGCIITWNPEAEKITGFAEPELIGRRATSTPIKKLITQKQGRCEVEVKTKSGAIKIISVESKEARSRSGINEIVTFIDITEDKEMERQLVIAKERAEEASRLRTEFLANMSHEIRTPLNGILGMTDILIEEEKNKEHLGMLSTIQQCGRRLLHLINEILELSKLEAGRERLRKKSEDLSFIINSAIASVDATFRRKGIDLKTDMDENLPDTIVTDSDKLTRVLTNLLSNGSKYTDAGFVKLSVAPYSGMQKGNILFTVEDTGRGIPDKRMKIIFESFVQAEDYLTREDGSGLGLSISKKLVELLGGDIWVESERGKGTKFFFTITSADDEEATEDV